MQLLTNFLKQKEDGLPYTRSINVRSMFPNSFKSEKFWLMCQLLLGPENMKGKLSVKNINNGALFAIHTPKIFK